MDNVTHGLIGLLVAEVALLKHFGTRGVAPAHLRTAALVCSIAANNTPDLDFVYTGVTGGKLGYLLHHRGHTHTFAALLPVGLLALLPVLIWAQRARPGWSRRDWGLLVGLCLLGPAVHIGMDALNSYGVHPLWPASNRWFYGDAVFIVEPLFFLCIGLLLTREARTRAGRVLLLLPPLIILGLGWALRIVSLPWAAGLTIFAVGLWLAGASLERRQRVLTALALVLGTIALFVGTRALAARQARVTLQRVVPGAESHDLVLTPLPANPRCWSFIAVQTEGRDYVLRRGHLALLASWLPVSECASRGDEGTTAPLTQSATLRDGPAVSWRGEFRAPLAELRALAQHCEAAAMLRFARAPYWVTRAGEPTVLGDLRYDRGEGLGFAAIELGTSPPRCPRAVPPWHPPRADLL